MTGSHHIQDTGTIRAIDFPEPLREGEYPFCVIVGHDLFGSTVTRIEHRIDNRGDHGVGWFDCYSGETLLSSYNERHTAGVRYVEVPDDRSA